MDPRDVPAGRRARRAAVLAPALLAVALTAGCSGDSPSGDGAPAGGSTSTSTSGAPGADASSAEQRVAAAARAWEDYGTATIELAVAAGGGAAGGQSVSARGAVDAEAGATRLTFELPGVGEVEVITTRDSVYLKGLPGQPDDAWAQVSAEQAATLGLSLDQTNPTETLLLLRGATDVRDEGTETIRGREATKLSGTIDLEQAVAAAGAGTAEGLRGAGVEEVPFTVYLDEQDRPLRFVQTLRLASGGARETSTITVDMDEWGQPVDIAVPDAADVVPLELPAPQATQG